MPQDTAMLMGLGIAAIVVVWLVFSVLKKLLGLLFLAALALGAVVLWNNPEMARGLMDAASGVLGR